MAKEPVRREQSNSISPTAPRIIAPAAAASPVGAATGANQHRDKSPILCGPALSRSAVYKAYRYYLDGFNDGKMDSIDTIMQYPLRRG